MKFWFKRGAWASRAARRKIATFAPETVRRIAVIRHAALGDMVLTRPFLLELRRHFPQAAITLSLASNYTRGAPEDLVDRVHTVYGSDRRDVPLRERIRRARELGAQDLLFDLAASNRSLWVCALNRARLKVGFPYHALQRALFYDATVLRTDFKFEAEVMLDMLHIIGLKTEYPLRFELPGAPMRRDRPYVVYFTTGSAPYKCWPAERFAALIARLAAAYPACDHLVLEGLAPWESVGALMAQLTELRNVEALRVPDLDTTVALLKGARLLVSNDTGIRNLAIAAGTPSVGIFLVTEVFRYWPRGGPHEAVFCADGSSPPVDAVAAAVDRLMQPSG